MDGPPFYDFALIDWIVNPQSLAVRGVNNDTLYAGNRNGISMSIADSPGAFGNLTEISIPDYSFGVEMPYCAALHHFTGDDRLWAGGYDMSPLPGPGHLLGQEGDSMVTVRNMNVSAITQGIFFEVGPLELVVATTDSGIYQYIPIVSSEPWTRYDSPGNEPVIDVTAVPGLMWSDILYLAVPSGVYSGLNGSWTEEGNIPEEPTCLSTGAWYNMQVYAGTQNGVYKFAEQGPVNTEASTGGRADLGMDILKASDGRIVIEYFLHKTAKVKIEVLDITGKALNTFSCGYNTSGRHILPLEKTGFPELESGGGIYFVRLSANNRKSIKRFVLVK
jgi:hypothetical protein